MKRMGKEFIAPKLKLFEDEAMDAFGEWCELNVELDEDLEDPYEELDLNLE